MNTPETFKSLNSIQKLFVVLYSVWCTFWFLFFFLLFCPIMLFSTINERLNFIGHAFFSLWAKLFFAISFKWPIIDWQYRPKKNEVFVYTANHFSYLDVAMGMFLFPKQFKYYGKSSVKKAPIFGYIFDQLHIAVDRSEKNSRANSLKKGINSLKNGISIYIMPEGGILSQNIPQMNTEIKDGAFILAISEKVPILPICHLNLNSIMPFNIIYWGRPKVIIKPPIKTHNLTIKDLESTKIKWRKIVQSEINSYYSIK